MKKIIIIEDVYADSESIAQICRLWPDELEILSASKVPDSLKILENEAVDLIIYDLSSGYGPHIDDLSSLTLRYPHIPCLAIMGKEQQLEDEVLKRGAASFLKSPPPPAEMRLHVHELLKNSNSGVVRGIPVHSLLQVLEIDEKTCSLKVVAGKKTGYIFLQEGVVVSAETGDEAGERAIYSILVWEDTITEIKYYNGKRPREIEKPLISLIMEASRLKDERDEKEGITDKSEKKKLEPSQFSTTGSYLSLEIGAKINMEIDEAETSFICDMVGMIADKFLIVTAPKPADLAKKVMRMNSKIVIKYIHMGRLCLFTSKIKHLTKNPQRLLYLEYPSVVHFHELRKARRTSVFVPGTLAYNGGGEVTGVLLDMSSMGCLYKVKTNDYSGLPKFDIDTEILLRCFLPGITDSQQLHGRVKNIAKSSSELRLGIEFVGMEENLQAAIERYVDSVETMGGW